MNKDMIVKLFVAFLVGYNVALVVSLIINNKKQKEYDNLEVLYEVKIENDYINVREEPRTTGNKTYEVLKGEEYEVVEVYDMGIQYNWYKIKFGMRRTGWIASPKNEEAWITIIEG